MKPQHIVITAGLLALSFGAVAQTEGTGEPLKEDPGSTESPQVTQAIAVLNPTQGNEAKGTVRFSQDGEGVQVQAEAENLTPGKHAYHVHLYGDCSAPDGKSAGPHFNFTGSSKHPPEDIDRITGNLGELEAGDDGKATAEGPIEMAALHGPFSIIGRAVIVHVKGNDPSQPPEGDAGGRVACGVIGIAQAGGGG